MDENNQSISIDLEQDNIEIELEKNPKVSEAGNSNYEDLFNKPRINGIYLLGDKTLKELGIQPEGEYLQEESDPTVPSHVKNITEEDISNWNNKLEEESDPTIPGYIKAITEDDIASWNSKSDFSGSYEDLEDKPTIPEEYVLPIASKEILGGIKPSDDFIVGKNGEMSINQEVYKKDTIVNVSNIELNEVIEAGTYYTIPLRYKAGNNSLEIFYCGTRLIKNIDYNEVGVDGDISNIVNFTENIGDLDMSGVEGFEDFKEILQIIVRGDYGAV